LAMDLDETEARSNLTDRPTEASQLMVTGRNERLAVLRCTVRSCYLAMTSEQTEDFICVLVIVICRM
jgi:hypothetical protein